MMRQKDAKSKSKRRHTGGRRPNKDFVRVTLGVPTEVLQILKAEQESRRVRTGFVFSLGALITEATQLVYKLEWKPTHEEWQREKRSA